MKYTISLLLFVTLNSASGQVCQWASTSANPADSYVASVKRDHDGNFLFASFTKTAGVLTGTTLEKFDDAQQPLWSISFSGNAAISDFEINSLNDVIVAGYFEDTLVIGMDTLLSTGYPSAFIFAADAFGTIYWNIKFNPAGGQFKPNDIFLDQFDRIYMAADISSSHGFCSFHLLDVWGTPMHDEFNDNFQNVTFSRIIADANGNMYLSGTCSDGATFDSLTAGAGSYQNFLVKYDSAFNAQWLITRGYVTFDNNNGIGYDGQYIYWSFVEDSANASNSVKLVKVDTSGQVVLDVKGPMENTFFPPVNFATDSNGNSLFVSAMFQYMQMFRYDNQFNQTWHDSIQIRTSGAQFLISTAIYDNSFYIASRYYGDSLFVDPFLLNNPHGSSSFNIFYGKWSTAPSTGIPSISDQSISVYPNPASTQFNLVLSHEQAVMNIYDCTMKLVESKNLEGKGDHHVSISNLTDGVYILQVIDKDSAILSNRILFKASN